MPDANFGWSARDACYSYGSFVLDDDEALVITHRPPSCRFWNLVVWNQFMATYGDAAPTLALRSTATARCSTATARSPSSCPARMTAHPNSLTTLGYPRGNLAFRWFLSDGVPTRPEVKLVKVSDAPTATT